MIEGLEAFTHGQIQDTLNVLKIMERESLTINDLKEHIKDIIFHPPKHIRRIKKENQKREFGKTKFGRIRGGGHRK